MSRRVDFPTDFPCKLDLWFTIEVGSGLYKKSYILNVIAGNEMLKLFTF